MMKHILFHGESQYSHFLSLSFRNTSDPLSYWLGCISTPLQFGDTWQSPKHVKLPSVIHKGLFTLHKVLWYYVSYCNSPIFKLVEKSYDTCDVSLENRVVWTRLNKCNYIYFTHQWIRCSMRYWSAILPVLCQASNLLSMNFQRWRTFSGPY